MKMLAVALPNRLKDFPDVPTFSQPGFPAVSLSGWSVMAMHAVSFSCFGLHSTTSQDSKEASSRRLPNGARYKPHAANARRSEIGTPPSITSQYSVMPSTVRPSQLYSVRLSVIRV